MQCPECFKRFLSDTGKHCWICNESFCSQKCLDVHEQRMKEEDKKSWGKGRKNHKMKTIDEVINAEDLTLLIQEISREKEWKAIENPKAAKMIGCFAHVIFENLNVKDPTMSLATTCATLETAFQLGVVIGRLQLTSLD